MPRLRPFLIAAMLGAPLFAAANPFEAPDADPDKLPSAPEGFEVRVFAKEPLVRNPAALAFDRRGRLFVAMGPQWRGPTAETKGDEVRMLVDDDGDGEADRFTVFAEGFNSAQAIAWRGDTLWVANSPDLTAVRDTDGDGVADEYTKVFTDLGNLEHSLHGLNFAPDGWLYMSKGNSKGISLAGEVPREPGRIAPQAFRELWGVAGPAGAPDLPEPQRFDRETYRRTHQDPRDDWGQMGGMLRFAPAERRLEIVARGFRNPWDIAFDAGFNWLGTDNDQTGGDRIFMPFRGAHFGWSHPWAPHWTGENNPPTTPCSGPIIEGSYTGIAFCDSPHFPDSARGTWFVADWMRRALYQYIPAWDGARSVPGGGRYGEFLRGEGALFRPVDIDFGPDGALWLCGWGREYGGAFDGSGAQKNEGRIFRLVAKDRPLVKAERPAKPIAEVGRCRALVADLGSWVAAWRINAQDELLRRGQRAAGPLLAALQNDPPPALETWALWTLARLGWQGDPAVTDANPNRRLQWLRAGRGDALAALADPDPRLRLAAVESAGGSSSTASASVPPELASAFVARLAEESDPTVYQALWRNLLPAADDAAARRMLADPRPGVRRAGALILMERLAIGDGEALALLDDPDKATKDLAALWLAKTKPASDQPAPAADPSDPPVPDAYPLARNIAAESGRAYAAGTLRAGEPTYTDRRYAVRAFPEFLRGAPMIRTANNDDGSAGSGLLRFDAPLAVTVYVAHDERAAAKPAWLADFGDSDSTIQTDDATYRLWAKDYPAGRITLGGNTPDGRAGGKGNYFVVLAPQPLAPRAALATADQSLAALPDADPVRGEALFHAAAGANCATCHTLGGRGHAFGPDLTGAGDRFDARHLIDSMLDPNAIVAEGFGLIAVTMKDGTAYSGVLRDQSGLAVTLALPGGGIAQLPRADIATEDRLSASAMPPMGALLSPQNIADLTAYLMGQKSVPQTGFAFQRQGDRLIASLDGQPIGAYLLRHDQLLRPAWIDIKTASGTPVTRDFPPAHPEDNDHAFNHPGITVAFGHLDGGDYWRNGARVEHIRFAEEPRGGPDEASFAVENRFLTAAGDSVACTQIARYTLRRHALGWTLRIAAEFSNPDRGFYFGDQEESGLCVRIATPLRVQGGSGAIVNSRGERDGAETWGKEADWWDYAGTAASGERAGVLVVPHPANARKCWGHTRDYGVMVINPFPRQPKERREPYVKTEVPRGEAFRLGYTVLIHGGAGEAAVARAAAALVGSE
ncbi:MAG: DUF6807 family protein [Verrucomicrobiales bacterium]